MFEIPRRHTLSLAAALLIHTACKRTENDWPTPTPHGYSYSQFADQLPGYFCEHLINCPDAREEIQVQRTLLLSVARCTQVATNQSGGLWQLELGDAVDSKRVIFHADEAHAYLDSLTTCASSIVQADPWAGGAFEGTIEPGGECATATECTSGNYCSHDGGACPGTCAKLKPTGADCTENAECASKYCNANLCSKYEVLEPAAAGEPCGVVPGAYATEIPCGKDLWCQGKPTGTCRKPVPADAPCTGPGDVCEIGHLCLTDVDDAKRCRPIDVAAGEGDLCTGETSPDVRLCDSFSFLTCEQSKCVGRAGGAEGGACVRTVFGDSCDPGLHCAAASQLCEPLGQAGDGCTGNDQCASGYCSSGSGTCSAISCG